MFLYKNMFLTKKISNLIKKINKNIKKSKTLIPFVQSPYQNWTDFGRIEGLDKGFYGIYYLKNILLEWKRAEWNVWLISNFILLFELT